jgi:hypothetical protein
VVDEKAEQREGGPQTDVEPLLPQLQLDCFHVSHGVSTKEVPSHDGVFENSLDLNHFEN